MCGCLKNRSSNASSFRVSGQVNSETNCRQLYLELATLDKKVIDMIKKEDSKMLSDINKQLRVWIRNLGTGCPPQEDLDIVKSYIETEYAKYNS